MLTLQVNSWLCVVEMTHPIWTRHRISNLTIAGSLSLRLTRAYSTWNLNLELHLQANFKKRVVGLSSTISFRLGSQYHTSSHSQGCKTDQCCYQITVSCRQTERNGGKGKTIHPTLRLPIIRSVLPSSAVIIVDWLLSPLRMHRQLRLHFQLERLITMGTIQPLQKSSLSLLTSLATACFLNPSPSKTPTDYCWNTWNSGKEPSDSSSSVAKPSACSCVTWPQPSISMNRVSWPRCCSLSSRAESWKGSFSRSK